MNTVDSIAGEAPSAHEKSPNHQSEENGDVKDALGMGLFSVNSPINTFNKAREEINTLFKGVARHSESITTLLTKAEDDIYHMNHDRRGICVIINQKTFSQFTGLNERRGTDVDAENLSRTFKALSFEVHMKKDLNEKELLKEIAIWSKYDHTTCDAFVFCLLSHGERDLIYHSEGKIATDDLFNPFTGDRCPSLLGKPKLFFIQACRGDCLDKGALAIDQIDGGGDSYRLPAHADFLIAYSTVAGYYSWRNTINGSWFIQALCDVLHNMSLVRRLDILALMTLVNKRVAFNFESCVPGNQEMDKRKQIPCVTFTLTRILFLTAKAEGSAV